MNLCFDDEEESRPECLSLHFFAALMITEAKKYAILQLLSFKKKRELVYSTRLNDGFFEVKVMVVQEAAKQLDVGLIKSNSILQGWIRNHGEGVIVIKEKLKFWDYGSKIGTPIAWKLKKQNINAKGSNYIVWNSQQLYELHEEQTQVVKQSQPIQAPNKQPDKRQKIKVEQAEVQKEKTSKSFSNLTETQSIILQKKEVEEKEQKKQITSSSIVQDQPMPQNVNVGSKASKQTKKEEKLSARSKDILSFIFEDDDMEKNEVEPMRVVHPQSNTKNSIRSDSVISLKTIFDCLNEEQSERVQQINTKQKQKQKDKTLSNEQINEETGDNSQQQQILQWFVNFKNQRKQKQKQTEMTRQKSSLKKKKQIYQQLIDESQSDEQTKAFSKYSVQVRKNNGNNIESKVMNNEERNDNSSLGSGEMIEVKFQDIFHGLFQKSSANWELQFILRCIGNQSNRNYINAIITDVTSSYLMNATFVNISMIQIQLQEGAIYIVSKAFIKAVNNYSNYNSSHSEMQFDCSKCIFSKVMDISQPSTFQKAQNYQLINAIYLLQDNQMVNTMGVLKSVRCINGKNSTIANFQIVDPIVKYSIVFTQFDAKINAEQIEAYINLPITIYNACSNSFRGKRNIVNKPKTIIKHNWLPHTQHTSLMRQWLEIADSNIHQLQLNLVGYTKINSLSRINSSIEPLVFVENVTITDINEKFTYLACIKCFKKVNENRCRSCGKRNQGEIIQRLFLRGTIGDSSSTVNVLWNNSIAESILSIGFSAFKKKWILKKVSVWLERGSNETITIMKVQQLSIRQRLPLLFDFITERIL